MRRSSARAVFERKCEAPWLKKVGLTLLILALPVNAQELRAVDYQLINEPCMTVQCASWGTDSCCGCGFTATPIWESRCDYPGFPCVSVLVSAGDEVGLFAGAWARTLLEPICPSALQPCVRFDVGAGAFAQDIWCFPGHEYLAASITFETTFQLFPTAPVQDGLFDIRITPGAVSVMRTIADDEGALANGNIEVRLEDGTLVFSADLSGTESVVLPEVLVRLAIGDRFRIRASASASALWTDIDAGAQRAECTFTVAMHADPAMHCVNPAMASSFNTINAPLLSAAGAPVSVPSGNSTWQLGVDCDAFGPGTIVMLRLRSSCTEGEITPMGQVLVAGDSPLNADLVSVYSGNSLPVTFGVTVPPAFCGSSLCAQALITPSPHGIPKVRRRPILTNAVTAVTGHQ